MSIDLIRDRFKEAGVKLEKDDFWSVQGTPVIKHRALEKLGAAVGIKWATPQILRSERDEAVILVTGTAGENTEWSIGEALVNANYRVTGKMAPYVFAMAEKRGKDRVIIKLAGLHGVYSEEEADEFKDAPRQIEAPGPDMEWSKTKRNALVTALEMAATTNDLRVWGEQHAAEIDKLLEADKQCVRSAYTEHQKKLRIAEREAERKVA